MLTVITSQSLGNLKIIIIIFSNLYIPLLKQGYLQSTKEQIRRVLPGDASI